MSYSQSDYQSLFQGLLPRGPVWPRDPASVQSQVIYALMGTYTRLAVRDLALLVDAFPSTTEELLEEWEWTLGLPDPCAGESATIQQRQGQVIARFAGDGGGSVQYFIDFAASLGYDITITQFTAAAVGYIRMGQPIYGPAWSYAWQVNAPQVSPVYFRTGVSAASEPLQTFTNLVLECEFQRLKPASTFVFFTY